MERIQQWIDSGSDYAQGIAIYKELPSCNKMLVRNLERVNSPLNRQKLTYELKKFLKPSISSGISTEAVVITTRSQSKPSKEKVSPLFHQLPAELRVVLLEANNIFKENCLLKIELNELGVDKESEALNIQLQIDKNFRANKICWDKIEYWQEHKQLPKSIDIPISKWSMDKLLKEVALLQSSVSRQEKRLLENKEKIKAEEGKELDRLLRLIAKQERDVIQKREQLFHLKTEIDVKGAN